MSAISGSCSTPTVVGYRTVETPPQTIATIITTPDGTRVQPVAPPANVTPVNSALGRTLNITV
ncbi:MAG: hypothetical protein WCO00_07680 [Rhodospirillaceae bacterium]